MNKSMTSKEEKIRIILDRFYTGKFDADDATVSILDLFQRNEAETRKQVIKEIYSEVIGNGSHDRSSIIHMLTHKYKEITGIDVPREI